SRTQGGGPYAGLRLAQRRSRSPSNCSPVGRASFRAGRRAATYHDRMRLAHCNNFHDFRELARRRLPGPIFNYIDGAADDEVTYRRNTASFEDCDLLPSVLRGVASVDMSVTVLGQKLAVPFYCSPTALQRLFHPRGERAVAAAASNY